MVTLIIATHSLLILLPTAVTARIVLVDSMALFRMVCFCTGIKVLPYCVAFMHNDSKPHS